MDMNKIFINALKYAPKLSHGIANDTLLGNTSYQEFLDEHFITMHAGGQITFTGQMCYSLRTLPCYIILYTSAGMGTCSISGKNYTLSRNTVLFYNCASDFKLSIAAASWTFYIGFITGSTLASLDAIFSQRFQYIYTLPAASIIPQTIHKLMGMPTVSNMQHALFVSKWFNDILTELCISSQACADEPIPVPSYMVEMKSKIDNRFVEHFTLSQAEDFYGINKYRLCREFTKYYHMSPLQYLNFRRIEAAKDYLLSTDYTVHEIALLVGFENTNHFINLFKKNTGTTPLAFKQAAPTSIRALHSPYTPGVLPQP